MKEVQKEIQQKSKEDTQKHGWTDISISRQISRQKERMKSYGETWRKHLFQKRWTMGGKACHRKDTKREDSLPFHLWVLLSRRKE